MTAYRSRIDGFVIGMTLFVSAALGVVLIVLLTSAVRRAFDALTVALLAGVLLVVAIVVFAYVYTPTAFHVEDDVLRIRRPASDVTIPLASVVGVKRLDAFLGLSFKTPPGGNSGLFGLYGTFYRRDLGKYQMYGRAGTGAVLIETQDGNVVVTPERRDQFISELSEKVATQTA